MREVSMTGPNRFRFLNVERELAAPSDWNHPEWDRLWIYNVHYFADLNSETAAQRASWHETIVRRWVAENEPGIGAGWEPYPVSLRIVNWIAWSLTGRSLDPEVVHSLAIQSRWLARRMERHLLANHLWANAKALLFAGCFFEGAEAAQWRQTGLNILRHELREQVLADGGHFERSPMYHAIVLEDLLDLIQLDLVYPGLAAAEDVGSWRATVQSMMRWLQVMTHPDGNIALFNDAAFGVAPTISKLNAYARKIGIEILIGSKDPLQVLPQSGYVRMQLGRAVVIADVGEIGPDYNPGHAHADTLSFELSVGGERVIVDAGTSRYDVSPERHWQRSTRAHNTVEIDGRDSSEVWSSFRVGRRARPKNVSWNAARGVITLRAAHDGYAPSIHTRTWTLTGKGLSIHDEIAGSLMKAIARFRFEPRWHLDAVAERDGRTIRWRTTGVESVEDSSWHPEFGRSLPCSVLAVTFRGGELETTLDWE